MFYKCQQNTNCTDKDARKLLLENRKLKQELERLEEKRTEAVKKATSLQAKVKQLEKYVPKNSMKGLF
jgi:cell division septum initiation protein DivIVA